MLAFRWQGRLQQVIVRIVKARPSPLSIRNPHLYILIKGGLKPNTPFFVPPVGSLPLWQAATIAARAWLAVIDAFAGALHTKVLASPELQQFC